MIFHCTGVCSKLLRRYCGRNLDVLGLRHLYFFYDLFDLGYLKQLRNDALTRLKIGSVLNLLNWISCFTKSYQYFPTLFSNFHVIISTVIACNKLFEKLDPASSKKPVFTRYLTLIKINVIFPKNYSNYSDVNKYKREYQKKNQNQNQNCIIHRHHPTPHCQITNQWIY